MTPEISIVITARNRARLLEFTLDTICRQKFSDYEIIVVEDGFDGGETRRVCDHMGARYFRRARRPDVPYSNPAVPINIGLRRAEGSIVILQNAECSHAGEETIDRLAAPVRGDRKWVHFAAVSARNPDGSHNHWYVHPLHDAGPRPFFFCGAIAREHVERLRGMDEDYQHYGWEDNDFADRMDAIGLKSLFSFDAVVHHQWHEGTDCWGIVDNALLYQKKSEDMKAGRIGPERNLGREWGSLDA